MALATRGFSGLDFGNAGRVRGRVTISERDVRSPIVGLPIEFDAGWAPDSLEWNRQREREVEARAWARSVIEPLRLLLAGWDSYQASAIDREAADLAEQLLAGMRLIPGLATPQAAPSRDGGVSIEWHRADLDLVISIGPGDEPPSAYYVREGHESEIDDLRVGDGRLEEALDSLITT